MLSRRLPVYESFSEENISEWMNADEQHEIQDDIITDMFKNHVKENIGDENDVNQKNMEHSTGLSSIEKTIEYIFFCKKRLHS